MKRNESTTDRIIRAVAGLAVGAGALAVGIGSVLGIGLLVIGAVLLVTAATGFCPIYRALGMSTNPVPADKR
jgi:uncharacterized membrane protein